MKSAKEVALYDFRLDGVGDGGLELAGDAVSALKVDKERSDVGEVSSNGSACDGRGFAVSMRKPGCSKRPRIALTGNCFEDSLPLPCFACKLETPFGLEGELLDDRTLYG